MTDAPFDQVAVALTADLSDLLEKTEKAVDITEKAGEEAGQAFHDAFAESLANAAQIVTQFAEQTGATLRQAAEALKGEGMFEFFSADQLSSAAEALEKFNVTLGDYRDGTKDNIELQQEMSKILKGEIIPVLEQQSELFDDIVKIFEEYGVVLTDDIKKGLEINLELMDQLNEEGVEQIYTTEQILDGAREKAIELALEEEMVQRVVDAYKEMGVTIPDALQRDKIRNHVKALGEHKDKFSDVKKEATSFTDKIIDQGKKLKDNEGILGSVNNVLGQFGINLGGMLSHVVKGTAALGALKLVFDEIKKATAFALKLTETTEELAAAFRINQLAGDDNNMTFREWYATAERVMEITGQPLQNSMEAVADTLREMGASTELADDQINNLIMTGARFAKQYGGTLPQSINQLSAFINTGLSESLRRLGLDLGKQEQNAKAFEMRLGTNIDKLSEADQRLVRYTLLMEELGSKTAETDDDLKSFADRVDDVNVRTEKATKTLGDMFVPITVKFKEFWANVKEGFAGLVGLIVITVQTMVADVVGNILALAAGVKFVLDNIGKEGFWKKMTDLPALLEKAATEGKMELLRYQVEQATGGLDDYASAAEGAADATGDLGDAIEATAEQIEAFIEAARKFDEGMARIEQKFIDRMDSITLQFSQRRADMETDFLRDMRDIDADAAVSRMDAIRGYMVDEIRLREDHALDIRQLEESYLLDLEDAVRDRDARGVLSLQRKFNLEKKQREEDYSVRQARLKQDFQIELAEIERQRQIRRQERWRQYQEALMDLQMQEERKRALARKAREDQERDLLTSINNRLMALQESAEGELTIEQEKLDALIEALIATYGPEGPWTLWHEAAVETTQQAAAGVADVQQQLIDSLWRTEGAIRNHVRFQQAAAAAVAAAWGGVATYDTYNVQDIQSLAGGAPARQRGGSFVATGPQAISVGEGRPERVDITPLSGSTGKPSAGFRGGGGEKIGIDLNVEASELLVVEVADQTMQEVADVFVNVEGGGSRIAGRR